VTTRQRDTPRALIRYALFSATVTVALVWLLYLVRDTLLLIYVAGLIAVAAVGAQLVWAVALVAGLGGVADLATLAVGQVVGAAGCLAMGLMLLGSDDEPLGLTLVAGAPLLIFGWPIA